MCSTETQCWDYRSRGHLPTPARWSRTGLALPGAWAALAHTGLPHREAPGKGDHGAATVPRMVVQPQVRAEPLRHGTGQSEADPVQLPHPGVRSCMEAGDAERSHSGWEAGLQAACPAVVAEARGPGSVTPGRLEPNSAFFFQTQHLQSCRGHSGPRGRACGGHRAGAGGTQSPWRREWGPYTQGNLSGRGDKILASYSVKTDSGQNHGNASGGEKGHHRSLHP